MFSVKRVAATEFTENDQNQVFDLVKNLILQKKVGVPLSFSDLFKVKNHCSAKKSRRPSEFLRFFQSQKCDFVQIVHSSNFVFHGKVKNLILRILRSNQCKSMKINENQ